MLRTLGLVFAALALFSMAGGHWAALQTVAWVGMLRDYARQSGSVATAVEQTFDGQHPCELCREIQTAKARERQPRPVALVQKDDAKAKAVVAASIHPAFFRPAQETVFFHAVTPGGPNRTEPPPTPPPRRAARAA